MGFTGGYRFRRFEGAAAPELHDCAIPGKVVVQRAAGLLDFEPVVKEGDTVKAGDPVFRAEAALSVTLVSPVGGLVETISETGATIASDGTSDAGSVPGHTRLPWHLDRGELLALFCSTGCTLLTDRPVLSAEEADMVRHVVINAVHNGPLDQAWTPSVTGDPSLFADGVRTLAAVFPNAEFVVAVNGRNEREMTGLVSGVSAVVRVLSDRYPQEHPRLLSRDAVGKRLVSPDGARDRSILIAAFFDIVQIAETMTRGRPLVDRILLVAGPGVSHPGWYRVRIGAAFGELKKLLLKSDGKGPWRIVRGNLFQGTAVENLDEPVRIDDREIAVIREADTRELWRFMRPGFAWDSYSLVTVAEALPLLPKRLDSGVHGGVRPCVQCNFCDEVCPVEIYPHLIWKYVLADRVDESFRFRPADCIGCGLCDYVCPSKIAISPSVAVAAEAYGKSRSADEGSD